MVQKHFQHSKQIKEQILEIYFEKWNHALLIIHNVTVKAFRY